MHIEVVTTAERLAEIELSWDELYRSDPHAHIYLSLDFLYSVAVRVPEKFRVLTAWTDDGRCVGLLPLMVTTQWSQTGQRLTNGLDMLGHVFDADYTGILCDPTVETEVCEVFANAISKMDFGRIILNYFSAPASRLEAFTTSFDRNVFDTRANEHLINDGRTNNRICPYIDLPDSFDDYLAGLSANSRQKTRRLLRQLDSDSQLRVAKSRPETYTQDVTILAQLWYAKHVAKKGEKRAARLADMFKEVVMLGLASGIAYLAILWRGDTPVAAQANYVDRSQRHVLFHVAGRDDSVRDLSVGLMLQAHCIRWAIANSMARYDFTIGDEAYKHSLGGVDREIFSAEVFTKTGANVTGRLDDVCREDVLPLIRQFVAKGREADARIALQQVREMWPGMAIDQKLLFLLDS